MLCARWAWSAGLRLRPSPGFGSSALVGCSRVASVCWPGPAASARCVYEALARAVCWLAADGGPCA
eukprot:8458649-Alexandrium_andersonii.AAC.1